MDKDGLEFRKKSTYADAKTNSAAPVLQTSSQDIASDSKSSNRQLTQRSETIKRVSSLFSMALIEYASLRNSSITWRELGIRAEEICEILKGRVMAQLEKSDEI